MNGKYYKTVSKAALFASVNRCILFSRFFFRMGEIRVKFQGKYSVFLVLAVSFKIIECLFFDLDCYINRRCCIPDLNSKVNILQNKYAKKYWRSLNLCQTVYAYFSSAYLTIKFSYRALHRFFILSRWPQKTPESDFVSFWW